MYVYCNRSQKTSQRVKNVLSRTFLFFTRCDVICDLLQYTYTEKCYLFVKYDTQRMYTYFTLSLYIYLTQLSIERKETNDERIWVILSKEFLEYYQCSVFFAFNWSFWNFQWMFQLCLLKQENWQRHFKFICFSTI